MDVKPDHLILDTPDDLPRYNFKFREACRWAFNNGYDYVFQILTDTFVVSSRLLSSGFASYDYVGTANHERTAIGGGAGMWLSRKTIQCLLEEEVLTTWLHDEWVGRVARKRGIQLIHDERYTNLGQQEPPHKNNQAITCHIANTPVVYNPQIMIDLYRNFNVTDSYLGHVDET
jgi:hypothetical protein